MHIVFCTSNRFAHFSATRSAECCTLTAFAIQMHIDGTHEKKDSYNNKLQPRYCKAVASATHLQKAVSILITQLDTGGSMFTPMDRE